MDELAFQVPLIDIRLILPVFIVAGWGVVLMIIDLYLPDERRQWLPWLAAAGLVPAFIQTVALWGLNLGTFTPDGRPPMILLDNFSSFLNATFLITGFISILISADFLEKVNLQKAEFYMLMLISLSGMMLMGMANDLILVFLALELLSIPLYILAGFAWPNLDSEEAALKYFLLGAFSSGFLVFGIALLYGATGSTALPVVLDGIAGSGALGLAGVGLLLVGFGFKVSAVPFHMWTPDVYQGAPTAVTAFMSVGAKIGGFAALLRVFISALPTVGDAWVPAVAVLAALTMIVGNVVALVQPNIKRMLAYSSISHAGYIMMGVAAGIGSPDGVSAALFYMFAYLFTNLGAFAIVAIVEREHNVGLDLEDYKGLAKRSLPLAMAMAYFMFSFTGVPPSGGFTGKFLIFSATLEAGLTWLALVGVVTSVVSGYFYLRVVYLMFMFDGEGELVTRRAIGTAVALSVVATLILGFVPGPWLDLAREAVLTTGQVLAGG